MNILDLLRADGSIVVNKKLARKIGLQEAVAYSELVSTFQYWAERGGLVDEKRQKTEDARWFFCTVESLEEKAMLSESVQKKVISRLVKLGLIEKKLMGLPARRYFTITEKIFTFFDTKVPKNAPKPAVDSVRSKSPDWSGENPGTGSADLADLDHGKSPPNNTYINNPLFNNTYLGYLEEEPSAPLGEKISDGSIPFRHSFSVTEIENSYKSLSPRMTETFSSLGLASTFQNRLVCYMAMGDLKYFSPAEFRKVWGPVDLAGGLDKKNKPINDPALYIVNGILRSARIGSTDENRAYVKQKAEKTKKPKTRASVPMAPGFDWLENSRGI